MLLSWDKWINLSEVSQYDIYYELWNELNSVKDELDELKERS